MAKASPAFPNPFLDKPRSDPLAFRTLSFEELAALNRAPRRAAKSGWTPPGRVFDMHHAGPGEPIDLAKYRPGDTFLTGSVRVKVQPDGRPDVTLLPGYEDGRSAARAGPQFIPPSPRDVSVDANMRLAASNSPLWFLRQVPNGRGWDYKNTKGREFEPFGNFNYGATGSTVLPEQVLLRGAGVAQRLAGTSSPAFKRSYGDDPVDQYWIAQGARYARRRD